MVCRNKKKLGRSIKNFIKSNDSVAEMVGTILLLGITIAIFSTIFYSVLSTEIHTSEPTPTIVASVEGSNIIFEHRGGDEIEINSEIRVKIAGIETSMTVNDYWGVGEKVAFPFAYNIDNTEAEVMVIDKNKNLMIMDGILDITPQSDIGLKITIDDYNPLINTFVNITLTATLYRGDLNASNIFVNYSLPEGITHISNSTSNGLYNNYTGLWEIYRIDIGESVELKLKVKITALGKVEPTQLAILMDGSGSISGPGGSVRYGAYDPGPNSDWMLFVKGLSEAVNNSIPHTGDIELIVIEFADGEATLEIDPIIVDDSSYNAISSEISTITHRGGNTPMACGLINCSNVINNSINHPSNGGRFHRQVVILVTDGVPTACCNLNDTDPYNSDDTCGVMSNKGSTVAARDNLINYVLEMNNSIDELNSIAVGVGGMYGDPDIPWLKENIVWPGNYTWTGGAPQGPGWVRGVNAWQNFSRAINETINLLFESINSHAEIISATPFDPNLDNNAVAITIKPTQ